MRYFGFTIRTPSEKHKLLKREIRRASHNVFEFVCATHESKPYSHVHILAGTRNPSPAIDKFLSLLPGAEWAQEITGSPRDYYNYIIAQGRHSAKQCDTQFIYSKEDELPLDP